MSDAEQEPTLPFVGGAVIPPQHAETRGLDSFTGKNTVDYVPAVPLSGLHVRCPHCHNPIELLPDAELDTINCSTCGSNFSLTNEDDPTRDARGITQVGHFKLVERLGMGGFGAVWKAYDAELDRTVAVKIPRSGQLDKFHQDLFLREARSAAQLRHPNIVPVYEVGRDGDTLYIVSEFVRGVALSDRLTAGPLSAREAVEICTKIADALHHAHEQGVIHRDLKPANVMLDADGEPHLMDFGLARREANEITMTVEGQVLGTPAYMSPEQAQGEGHTADRRSDVYSVGVMLFQLLTGELPFRGNSRMLIHQVIHDEPPSPRKLNSSVPRDLETIVLKCMEKDPNRRFATANDLADEFQRYLAEKPILARPITKFERSWRWCRRNSLVAALVFSVLLLVGVIAAVSPIVAMRESMLRRQANDKNIELSEKNTQLQNTLTMAQIDRATAECESGRVSSGLAILASAYTNASHDNIFRNSARNLLAGWTEGGATHLVHDGPVIYTAFSPDDKALITATRDSIQVWNPETMAPVDELLLERNAPIKSVLLSAKGPLIVSLHDRTVTKNTAVGTSYEQHNTLQQWDILAGKSLGSELRQAESISTYALSPNGKYLLSADSGNTLQLWVAMTGAPIGNPIRSSTSAEDRSKDQWMSPFSSAAAFGHDGQTVLSTNTGRLRKYDISQFLDTKTAVPVPDSVDISDGIASTTCVKFSPDGTKLLVARYGSSQVWDVESGKPLGIPLTQTRIWGDRGVTFSPDSRTLATGGTDGTIQIWDATTGKPIGLRMLHESTVTAIAFNANGESLLTGSADKTARLWDTATGTPLSGPMHHLTEVTSVCFSASGHALVTASTDGIVQIWNQRTAGGVNTEVQSFIADNGTIRYVGFSPDGRSIFTVGGDVRLWNVATGQQMGEPINLNLAPFASVAFTTDGCLMTAGTDHSVQMWDKQSLKPLKQLLHLENGFSSVSFSPDGRRLLTRTYENVSRDEDTTRYTGVGPTQLWDMRSGKPIGDQRSEESSSPVDVFSLDSRVLLSTDNQIALLWDANTGRPLGKPLNHAGYFSNQIKVAALNADGSMALTADQDTVQLWNTKTGQSVGEACPHGGELVSAAFSPNGNCVVTSGNDVRLWDAMTGKLRVPPLEFKSAVNAVAFSPDGQILVTGSNVAQFWDVMTGKAIGISLPHPEPVHSISFSPNGSFVVTGSEDGIARLWSVPQLTDNPAYVRSLVRARTGLEVDSRGLLRQLSQAEWQTAQREVHALKKHPALP